MKASTKAKIAMWKNRAIRFVKNNGKYLFFGATVAAAWSGHKHGVQNQKAVAMLTQRTDVLKNVVNNNADCILYDRARMLELEHRQNELFERALKETEGKAD